MAGLSKGKKRLPPTLIAVNAVKEEIGGHGAKMATHRLMPVAAIVLDVTLATNRPTVNMKRYGEVTLGGGPSHEFKVRL